MADLLDGVDENTPRSELLRRLRDAAGQLFQRQDERVARLEEIEDRIRRNWVSQDHAAIQVMATSSEAEWKQAVEFLSEFEDLLPIALLRVYDGARMGLKKEVS